MLGDCFIATMSHTGEILKSLVWYTTQTGTDLLEGIDCKNFAVQTSPQYNSIIIVGTRFSVNKETNGDVATEKRQLLILKAIDTF